MRWVLRLIATGDDDRCLSTDLAEICRPEGLGDIADAQPECVHLFQRFAAQPVRWHGPKHAMRQPRRLQPGDE
jgi:hypothetical protein